MRKKLPFLFEDGDIKYLYKNSRYKLYFELTMFTCGFFISWAFANYTTPEFYGTYLFIINIVQFFSFLGFSGVSQSITQSVANGYEEFYYDGKKKIFLLSLSGTLALCIYGIMYSVFIDSNLVIFTSLIISAAFFPFANMFNQYSFYLAGRGSFKKEFIFRIINYIISVFLLIMLIYLTKNLIFHFFILNFILITLNAYYSYTIVKNLNRELVKPEQDKKALRYGINLTKYSFITLISSNINNTIIGIFFGPGALAFFTIGKGLSAKIRLLIKPSLSVLLTKYSREGAKLSKRFLILILIGSVLLFFVTLLVLPFYLQILFPTYLSSISYGIAYAFIPLITPFTIVIGYYFRGKVEVKVIRNSQIIPDILSLILIAPLLILFGIYGLILNEFLRFLLRIIIYGLYWKRIDFA